MTKHFRLQKYPTCKHAEGQTFLERVYYGVDYCYVDVDVDVGLESLF